MMRNIKQSAKELSDYFAGFFVGVVCCTTIAILTFSLVMALR